MPETAEAGLLDTSVVILLSQLHDASLLPTVPLISTITLAEVSVGPLVAQTDTERAARQAVLQHAEAGFDPLPFDDRAARAFGRVAASLRTSRRTVKARSYDAMIAAIAIANDLPLNTTNPADVDGIEGLDVRAVPLAAPAPPRTGETTADRVDDRSTVRRPLPRRVASAEDGRRER